MSSSLHVRSGIVLVDGVGRISYGHCLYHASPFISITCVLFHQSIFLHLILCLLFSRLFRSSSSLLQFISNFKAFTVTFSSSFLKTLPYHRILNLLTLAILSKDSYAQHVHLLLAVFSVLKLHTTHSSNHRSICSSPNCHLFFSQASCFTSI